MSAHQRNAPLAQVIDIDMKVSMFTDESGWAIFCPG
jgi:hypothetical protein